MKQDIELVTSAEAAKMLCISVKTLANWRYLRQGPPYVHVGSAVRYRVADLEGFLKDAERSPP